MCPACRDELEKKFQQVKEYVRSNKNVTIPDLSKEYDIPESQIKEWVRDERLVFSDAASAGITCDICGTAISTGRYCDKCKVQVMRDMNSVIKRPEPAKKTVIRDNGPKMRFLDNR